MSVKGLKTGKFLKAPWLGTDSANPSAASVRSLGLTMLGERFA